MFKGLRLPVLIFLAAFIFLAGAVYVRFIEADNDNEHPSGSSDRVTECTDTPSPFPADVPTATPAPTLSPPPPPSYVAVALDGQLTEEVIGRIGKLNPLYATYIPV